MGLGHWLSEAVASVSESLTGRKRKAPDGRLDEENEDLGLPPAPPLPSIDRPVVKPSQHLPSNRAPQRLDFSSPAMNGPQRGTGQWPPLGAAGQEQQKANPSHPIRLPALPARRLDDMLGVAAGTYTRGQQDMQAGSAAAAAGLDGVVDGQPFARHFAPPRVSTPLRGGSTPDLLRGIQHVRDAPPSYAKVALTPAAAQYRKQQRYQEPPPGQMRGLPAGGSRNVTQPRQQQGLRGQVQGQPGGQQQWQQPHRGLHRQQQQQQQQHAGGGSSLHRLATAGRHADERPSSSQDAALLRRAVEVRLRQQEVQQQRYQEQRSRHQLAAGAGVEEVDLTAEPSPSQAAPLPLPRHQRAEQQQDQAPPAAARGMGEPRHWREILQQLKAEEEEGGLGRWGDGPTGGPLVAGVRSEGAERYQELVADAQLASRRALQAQEQELRFAQQAHTALERAQPQRAQQLEAEAQKIERQLRELQLQRQQQQQSVASMGMQQAEQQQGLGAAVKSAREQEDGQEVVELLSSSEGERASAETSVGGSESEGEGQEESEVSQQLEQIGLHEGSDAMLAIPDSWREEYEAALGPGPAGEVLTDHPRSSIQVCRRDMACMAPLQWLNDEVINLYISLLLERDMLRRKQGKGPRCHFFSTFFANKLYKDGGYSYDQVRRWTLPKRLSAAGQASESILNCDRVVVPVHQGMHWVCAVIDLQHRKLVYYDSLKGEDHNCLEQLARYLRDEYRDKRKQQRDDVLDWPREFPKRIPQQLNGCDCGVFTLLFANYAGRDAPLTFSQAHIDDLRVRIVHELLQLRVE